LMRAMPRPRPPYLLRETKRGKTVWYVRRSKTTPRYRIRSEFGSEAFREEYEAALRGERTGRGKAPEGSLRWLWDAYRAAHTWQSLAPATKRQRENIMLHVLKENGDKDFAAIRRAHIVAGLDKRRETPSAARNFLDTMRGLFQWALERGHLKTDPTADVRSPKRRKGAGFAPWTREEVDAYQARWPLGTRQRIWLDVLLYTGLRRGDAARLGPAHVDEDGVISITTEKTGTPVVIPMLVVLQRTLLAGPRGAGYWILTSTGEALRQGSLRERLRRGRQGRRHQQERPRRPEDRRDRCGRERRHRGRAERHLRLDRKPAILALHEAGEPGAVGRAGGRKAEFYPLKAGQCEGTSAECEGKSASYKPCGGGGRSTIT
jgi:integrase